MTFKLKMLAIPILLGIGALKVAYANSLSDLPDYTYNYKDFTSNSTEVDTLTTELMGDKVDYATGSLSFTQTDLTLTVNGGLTFAIERVLTDVDSFSSQSLEFANWSLKLPHVRSTYIENFDKEHGGHSWVNGQACSSPLLKPTVTKKLSGKDYYAYPEMYWSGDMLSLPGESSQVLLQSQRNVFDRVTKGEHKISCITGEDGREGFQVTNTQGITYTLDIERVVKDPTNTYTMTTPDEGSPNICILENCTDVGVPDKDGPGSNSPLLTYNKSTIFLLASKIEDKFGNFIKLNYIDDRISSITTSDNQSVKFTWTNDNAYVESVSYNDRVWLYNYKYDNKDGYYYQNTNLEKVILPNKSNWLFTHPNWSKYNDNRPQWRDTDFALDATSSCSTQGTISNSDKFIEIKHPTGAQATFWVDYKCLLQTKVPKILKHHDASNGYTGERVWLPSKSNNYGIWAKQLKISDTETYHWDYNYRDIGASFVEANEHHDFRNTPLTEIDKRETIVTNPDKSKKVYVHDKRYGTTSNNLVSERILDKNGNKLKEKIYTYTYSEEYGVDDIIPYFGQSSNPYKKVRKNYTSNIQVTVNNELVEIFHKDKSDNSVKSYKYEVDFQTFNEYLKPTYVVEKNHTENKYKHIKLDYYHDMAAYHLNQPSTIQVSSDSILNNASHLAARTTYKSVDLVNQGRTHTLDLPHQIEVHGQLKKTFNAYHGHGGLEKVTFNDGTGKRVIRYSDYKHNTAQTITLPNRYFDAQSMSINKVIDENGWVRQIKNLNDVTTDYGYDEVGRITSIDLANDTDQNWLDTQFTWNDDTLTRSVRRCFLNALGECDPTSVEYLNVEQYDGLYRLISKTETDLSEHASSINPTRYQRFSYDYKNQPTFESFPSFEPLEEIETSAVNDALERWGTSTLYDALGRKESVTVSGLGTTRFEYLSGHKMSVTDAKGHTTKTTYQAFGSPAYDIATLIESPESVTTAMDVNLFGLVESITQSGEGVSVTETRRYDDNQNLCLIIRPDVGNTLMGHNALGQVMWQKQGVDNTQCVTTQPSDATVFKYDNLGDSHTVTFPVGTPSLTYEHDNNGNLLSLTAGSVNHTYYYNNQGALELERLTINNTLQSEVDYGYNSALAQSYIAYPDGTTVQYSPNGFGQPTRAVVLDANGAVELAFAEDVSYHPTGQPARFIYGNKAVHSLELDPLSNLPKTLTDTLGTSPLVNLTYDYDSNANVTAIKDNVNNAYSLTSLVYDGLNRLREVQGGLAIGNSEITYDALGNISTYKSKDRDLTYHYQNSTNRLERVTGLGTNGKYGVINYDARGNVTHNGGFAMDYNLANQMVEAKGNRYLYDGHNRRVKQEDGNGTSYSLYSQSGVLLYREKDAFAGEGTSYIYLGKKLIAKYGDVTPPTANNDRQYHRPFGETINQPKDDVGYTGHKFDTDLNLSYMQARYYDPVIGRFYGNDPLGFRDVHSFNRYAYANNNPYKYTDPDGENPKLIADFAMNVAINVATTGSPGLASAADDTIRGAFNPMNTVEKAQKLKKIYITYTKTNKKTAEVYSGRTSGTGDADDILKKRDRNHHKNADGFGPAQTDKVSDNSAAIRGREQQLIDANGGAKSQGGTSGNAINGISDKNPKKQDYIDAANKEF